MSRSFDRDPRRAARSRPHGGLDALSAQSFPGSDAPGLGGPSAVAAGPVAPTASPTERITGVLDEAHVTLPVPQLAELLTLVDATGAELEDGRAPADHLPAAADGRSAAVRDRLAPVVALLRHELGPNGGPVPRRRRLGGWLRARAEDVAARPRGAAVLPA